MCCENPGKGDTTSGLSSTTKWEICGKNSKEILISLKANWLFKAKVKIMVRYN